MRNILIKCQTNARLDYWFRYLYKFFKKNNIKFLSYRTKNEIVVLNRFVIYFVVNNSNYDFYKKMIGRHIYYDYITSDIELSKNFLKEIKQFF